MRLAAALCEGAPLADGQQLVQQQSLSRAHWPEKLSGSVLLQDSNQRPCMESVPALRITPAEWKGKKTDILFPSVQLAFVYSTVGIVYWPRNLFREIPIGKQAC